MKQTMINREKEGLRWLEFSLLQQFPEVQHAVFLRHGGVSVGAFSSLNVSKNQGDELSAVEENRRRILRLFPSATLQPASQVHGDHIAEEGVCDGLITTQKKKALMIQHADCQAALFYDPCLHLLANVHAGWRGSVQDIYLKTIEEFKRRGSHPSNVFVCISPSLGPAAAEFIHYKKELPSSFWDFQVQECLFDFWQISRWQLTRAGVLPDHVQIASICTHDNPEDYFSYRRDKNTGRHATIGMLL